ncbi:MAG: FAD-binding oxidoreductase [Hyphomicrobiales bacterium]|nr:FAD-binding oxidoreductase [Hyphomicrobiales bacterium]
MPQESAMLQALGELIGQAHVLTDADVTAAFLSEPRGLYHGKAACVVRPGSTAEVAAVLRYCHAQRLSVVPQGGNTGLVGGQTPDASGKAIVLSLQRLARLREIDAAAHVMVVEAGMTLAEAQSHARDAGMLFPLSLASEGTCTIGGNLATNAGGTAVIAYGSTRDLVAGLEVVLADGRVLNGLSSLKKDNTGYDLKHLFMGSEGTLGVMTAASLKLFPQPRHVETAFIGLASPDQALVLLALAQAHAGNALKTFELMPRLGIEFVVRHAPGHRDPLQKPHAWYVLMELAASAEGDLQATALEMLETALNRGVIEDATLAESGAQRDALWRLREDLPDVQKREGGSIKHDISVPIAAVPEFLRVAGAAVLQAMPGARPVPFGHLGDGNIHFNISQPVGADTAGFLARWGEINALVHAIVTRMGGSISAEHGIGQLKRELLQQVKDPVALEVMRALKATLDPHGILNPGKVL